jgi:hypothetical protein
MPAGLNNQFHFSSVHSTEESNHAAHGVWEGWFGYDRKKYAAMLREALEPFVLCLPSTAEEHLFTDSLTEEELKMFPLFTPLALLRPLKL